MSNMYRVPFKVAVAQATPIFLDRVATLEKACELIVDAGLAGARLIVFPAAFIPGYPAWVWTSPTSQLSGSNELYERWIANSVSIPSETTDRLCRIAQRARITIVMGLNELATETGTATCYNTLLYIDDQGHILGKHRSLVVTDEERRVWAQGNGSTLRVHKLPIATISGLIGEEHYLPLARYALYAWGTQIYLASAWDRGEPWLSTVRHIAKEGKVFVLSCGMALHTDDILASNPVKQLNSDDMGTWLHPGDSVIVNPNGTFIAGPVREKEEILYAEIDPSQLCKSRGALDGMAQDAQPDIFQLTVLRNEERISTLPN